MAFDGYSGGSGNWLLSDGTLAHGIGTGDFTMGGWFYRRSTSFGKTVAIGIGSLQAANSVHILTSDTTGRFAAHASDGTYTFNTTLTINAWQHLAIVKSGTTVYGYVNGAQEATTWSGYALGSGSIGTSSVVVGGTGGTYAQVSGTDAAECAIWTAALSVAEVAALVDRMRPPDVRTSGLKLYLPTVREAVDRWSFGCAFTGQSAGASYVTHPPVIEPLLGSVPGFSAAAASGNRRRRILMRAA